MVVEKKDLKFGFGRIVVLGVVGDKDIKDILVFKLGFLKKVFVIKVNRRFGKYGLKIRV